MPETRLELLKRMLEQDPRNTFARYGLAMEHKNAGEWEGAIASFQQLLEVDSQYSAAYFHGGQSLEKLGRVEEAREMYRRGVEVTAAKGDDHARSEMQAALDLLP